MKKTLSICLGIIFALTLTLAFLPTMLETPVSAATSGTTGDCTWTLDGTVLTISGNGPMWNYGFSSRAPWGTSITKAIIEDGVSSIGDYAFYNCTSLTSITIPDSVTTIYARAFQSCSNLKTVYYGGSRKDWSQISGTSEFPEKAIYYHGCTEATHQYSSDCDTICNNCLATRSTVWSNHQFKGDTVFCKNCGAHRYLSYYAETDDDSFRITDCDDSLTGELVIPETIEGVPVTGISDGLHYAFYNCKSITSIAIPSSVTSISGGSFEGCTSLATVHISDLKAWCEISFTNSSNPFCYAENLYLNGEKITNLVIPQGTTKINNFAFEYCTFLTSVTIPDSVTSIGRNAFYRCKFLASVTIPDSVTSIGDYAFFSCTSLTSITIPDSVTSIGYYAFKGCSGLESVTIGNSVTSIGYGAFEGCTSLKEIHFPKSVTTINYDTFNNCTALTDIWYAGSRSDRDLITRESGNDALLSATWHFNTCAPDAHVFDNEDDLDCNNCEWKKAPPYTPGDVDGVEGVTLDDAIYALFAVNFPESYAVNQPIDFDGNGKVDLDDAIHLLFHVNFPSSYPLH